MSAYTSWDEVKRSARSADPRSSEEQVAGREVAAERLTAYERGHRLAEVRRAAGVTQTQLARAMGVSQARISKIEHGDVSGIDVIRDYVAALGGSVDVVATLDGRTWNVA